MNRTRRGLLASAGAIAAFALAGCATTGAGPSAFATVQADVALAASTLDKLVPLVSGFLSPAQAASIAAIMGDVDSAAQAFAQLPDPTNAASSAQGIIALVSQGLDIVSSIGGLSPSLAGIVAAARVVLGAIGAFFPAPAMRTAAMAVTGPAISADQARQQLRAFLAAR